MDSRSAVIVPVSGRSDLSRRCIDSIRRHTPAGRYDLVLVAGPESRLDGLERAGRIVWDPREFNFAARVNRAIEETASDKDVILVNNDVTVTPGWFQALTSDPFALASARTAPGRCGNPDAWGRGGARATSHPLNFFCVWLPKWVRDVVGRLDERFDAYGGEDCDYTFRARRLAIRTLVSSAFVEHIKHGSFGPGVLHGPLQEGMSQFAEKWGVPLEKAFGARAAPRVSVVVANRNHGRYLHEAVMSIAEQDYPRLDIVIVDDGSKDDSAQVLRRLERDALTRDKIRVVRREFRGPQSAKNEGLRLAAGDIVTFQDADDKSLPERISKQLAFLRTSGGTDFVYTDLIQLGPGGVELAPFKTGEFDLDKLSSMQMWVAGATLMARKPTWERTGGFDESENLSRAYDFDLILRAASMGMRFAFLPEKLYVYRRHGNNSCGTDEAIQQHIARSRRFRLQAAGVFQ